MSDPFVLNWRVCGTEGTPIISIWFSYIAEIQNIDLASQILILERLRVLR